MLELKKPSECSNGDLKKFTALVIRGGEVQSNSLSDRIKNSYYLAFYYAKNKKLVAVGAIKKPSKNYTERIFKKAQYTCNSIFFDYELGYIYVDPLFRGKGIGEKIVSSLIKNTFEKPIYATTRLSNISMQKILDKHHFNIVGYTYTSNLGGHLLLLYVKIK